MCIRDSGIPVPYYTEDVSTKVVKIIQSYTGVVNKMVWRKNLSLIHIYWRAVVGWVSLTGSEVVYTLT